MSAEPLTDRQREVYDFFVSYIRENGLPPTIRDVMQAMKISSPNGVSCHIKAIVKKGWFVRIGEGLSRGVVPVVAAGCPCPWCGHATSDAEATPDRVPAARQGLSRGH